MASSSVSQESLDREDYDFIVRQQRGSVSRLRAVRGRVWGAGTGARNDSMESADMDSPDIGPTSHCTTSTIAEVGGPEQGGEHDSPTRMASRLKDKRGRPIHLHKGKTAKDKRKLREKRRSTGVVHLASTESTGDSLDEDDKLSEARRNTTYNEVIDADNPQTPEEDRKGYGTRTRNKSPSDLEADLEDNQDYDSTVSQSETNLTMIGAGLPATGPAPTPTSRLRMHHHHHHHHHPGMGGEKASAVGSALTSTAEDSVEPPLPPPSQRPVSYPSRFTDKDKEIEKYMGAAPEGPLKSSLSSRCHSKDSSGEAAPTGGRGGRSEHVRWRDRSGTDSDSALVERNHELEKALEQERQESQRLRELLQDRDALIADLRQEIALLHKDLEVADEDFLVVKQENQALLRALASLTIDC